ncbi:hypothetical protein BRE01_59280 [Brevibacillus reuszeri]|uniref:SLH domain-containing protein n=2 Tax=Brevibacillus reuszeri TaxID=54915 RepID=A0A0K9YTY7_9BACL|nr:S-layer homology domain-containing protein [Brevibacillus reuszeri]KNB72179.1 hypothetical protein ADS79_09665 [Brevibacillus reuszeri]GED72226.1 hypothetical protein BRE01_59280 [Brevibacillus reuszeri]
MKKMLILASLVALTLVGTPAVEAETNTNTATPYADIAGHWAEKEIEKCYIAGAVGTSGDFRPDEAVTRIELLTMFVKAKGIEPVQTNQSSFKDIPADSWMTPYAEIAYRLGIVHGQKQGKDIYLRPNEPVQREELVSMLIRSAGNSGAVNQLKWSTTVQALAKFPDGNRIQEADQRPFVYALQNGMMNAYADGTLQPQKLMTRAEAATYAAFHLLPGKASEQKTLANGTSYRQVMTVQTTAYSYATDKILSYLEYPLREGVVAVDPKIIPLGSHLYIEGYGYAVAADIGGAVKDQHVDLYLPTLSDAENYGLKKGVQVFLLD